MKLILLFFGITVLYSNPSLSLPLESSENTIAVCNEAFDKLLDETFDKFSDELEPYRGKEWKASFQQKILFKNWTGLIRLHDVEVDGLTEGKRVSNAHLIYGSDGRKTLEVTFLFPKLFYTAKSTVALIGFGWEMSLFGFASDIRVETDITFDAKTESLELSKFSIKSMNEVKLRVDGAPLGLSAIYNFVLDIVTTYAKRTHRYVVEKMFAHRISRVLIDSAEADILKNILHSL